MKTEAATPAELRVRGFKALKKELGADGAVRFLQQFSNGSGDYTAERNQLLGSLSVDELVFKWKTGKKKP